MLEEDFLEAIVKGDSQRVVRLLGQISDTGPIKDGRNALHVAAQYGNADIVSVLLLSGLYDCKTADSIGYTALHFAAAEGYLEIVKQLIKSGSDVNAADNVHGNTALHDAAWKGYSRTVAELAKSKANLNVKNCGGFTPLHLSCQNGHNQSCRELLLAGCDPDVQNNYGDTPLHTSARYGHAGVMRILISAQCHVSDQNKNGDTALHIAAAMNRRKLTRILLESDCNKQAVNKQNETAEDIAIRKSHAEILEILRNPIPRSKKLTKISEPVAAVADCAKVENKRAHAKKSTKDKKGAEAAVSVPAPATAQNSSVPWSPYGCHYYPDSTEFPEPRLDSLPAEPLRKGEQYYLDLAGNIRKGPVGVGYSCYCAPMFHELENRIEKKTKKIQKQIHRAEDAINKRLNTLEYCLGNQQLPTAHNSNFRADYCSNQYSNAPHSPLSHTRSLESIFNRKNDGKHNDEDEDDDGGGGGVKKSSNYAEKRKNILFLKNKVADGSQNPYSSSLNASFPAESDDTSLSIGERRSRSKLYSSVGLKGCSKSSLWKSSRLDADSCDSSDEDCEKITDIPCNDSGYSTKLCSNSQGPSPSLSGRLENDGLLSITPSQEEKRTVELNTFMSTFKSMSLKQASVV